MEMAYRDHSVLAVMAVNFLLQWVVTEQCRGRILLMLFMSWCTWTLNFKLILGEVFTFLSTVAQLVVSLTCEYGFRTCFKINIKYGLTMLFLMCMSPALANIFIFQGFFSTKRLNAVVMVASRQYRLNGLLFTSAA